MPQDSIIDKKTGQLIASLLFIVIGVYSLFQNTLAGILLVVIGLGVSSQVQAWLLTSVKFLYSLITKRDVGGTNQTMTESSGGTQQNAGRDINVIINNYAKEIRHFDSQVKSNDDKKIILKNIYIKMVKAVQSLNTGANVGLGNKNNFYNISKDIEDYKNANIESDLDLVKDTELKKKLNAFAIALEDTKNELSLKLKNGELKEGLHGTKSFNFVMKFEEAVKEIEKYFI